MVSIVIPVYNAQRTLRTALRSVQRQTCGDWQCILVDDGSADRSGAMCDAYARRDPRFVVLHQENRGAVDARKAGIAKAQGDYITFLDADDALEPEALQVCLRAALTHGADLVCFGMKRMARGLPLAGRTDKNHAPARVFDHGQIMREWYLAYFGVSGLPGSLCIKLFATELIRTTLDDPTIVRFFYDDLSVCLRLLPQVRRMALLQDRLYRYRLGGGTNRFMPCFFDDCLAVHALQQEALRHPDFPKREEAVYYSAVELKNELFSHLVFCRQKGQFTQEQLRTELLRYAQLPQVRQALTHPKADASGCAGFREAVLREDWDEALRLVVAQPAEAWYLRLVKRLA
ncbi:MAG: glycosyltransferase [Oscillospiraceae bacterium]|jgi:glycosyltransferase involved in cell wall biosynthesis|nr:glycosyltransferase [Oscillospiraceae bacterium]